MDNHVPSDAYDHDYTMPLQYYEGFSGCEEGAVRLVDGAIEQEGRVEVCIDGVWGSVCGGGTIKWTRIEASVVCKQLGYSVKGMVDNHVIYEQCSTLILYTLLTGSVGYSVYSYGPIVYGEAICGGWEQKFIQCQKKEYGSFHCSGTAVGVRCKDGECAVTIVKPYCTMF